MTLWHFIFSFLYTRNWHSGARELSRPRVALFAAGIFLVLLAFTLISFLQAPLVYIPEVAP
jgi:hypothetical protein